MTFESKNGSQLDSMRASERVGRAVAFLNKN